MYNEPRMGKVEETIAPLCVEVEMSSLNENLVVFFTGVVLCHGFVNCIARDLERKSLLMFVNFRAFEEAKSKN